MEETSEKTGMKREHLELAGSVDDNVGVVPALLTMGATDGGCGGDEGDGGDVSVVDVTQKVR